MDVLKDLTPEQREAVTWDGGPLLVLAGAGSGKTRVLTHRIAYLIGVKGIPPHRILAVTFTNKAANEMRERMESLIGPTDHVWMSTFHSFCARVLRRHAERLGYPPGFCIYDESDKLTLVKRLLEESNISHSQLSPALVCSRISGAKNALIDPEDYGQYAHDPWERKVLAIYQRYQERLLQNGAMDFDDLLMLMVRLLAQEEKVRNEYNERFQHILVDEFQDTNRCQFILLNYLVERHRNLSVVGDDDQSIYSFRGADITNILDFEKTYPDCHTVRLEQNFRSTRLILKAASEVVSNNAGRKGKELWTSNPEGELITLLEAADEREEAELVLQELMAEVQVRGRSLDDIVLLYRTNAQSRAFEEALRMSNLPYNIVGGPRFYERKEIKDLVAYLRLLINPSDSLSLVRIINIPPRRIGRATVEKVLAEAARRSLPPYHLLALLDGSEGFSSQRVSALSTFHDMMERMRHQVTTLNAAEILNLVLYETRYVDFLMQEGTLEGELRAENVNEFLASAEDFSSRSPDPSLETFMEEVSLFTNIDRWEQDLERLTLMTIHNAKGLEFPLVFICGLEDGLFPHRSSFDAPGDLEEERRLFYVGLTRAQEKVYLSFARRRRRFGDNWSSIPSRFLREIPDHLMDTPEGGRPTLEEVSGYAAGDLVVHAEWGVGRIVNLEEGGDRLKATIVFRNGGRKKVMLKYAPLVPYRPERDF
jgi:DNA helicase-2/ATP-dependent DNA helicase PcrA